MTTVICHFCEGVGKTKKVDWHSCSSCKGKGFTEIGPTADVCVTCQGVGKLPRNTYTPCELCHGEGSILISITKYL